MSNLHKNHEPWLQSLRGVAALLVFISHLPLYARNPDLGFILGRIGVVCFFLMTGYLAITARKRRSGKQYLINRFFRLYPVFWLLLIFRFLELGTDTISVEAWLANITLFEEFLLQPKVFGSSWMLPIQIVFFVTLMVKGERFFIDEEKSKSCNESRGIILMCSIMFLSIIVGFARYKTNVSFPTAFFLLQAVAYGGVYYKAMIDGVISRNGLWRMLVVFEVGLMIAVGLSYERIISYFIAYNIGIALFLLYHLNNIKHMLSIQLGRIGFTFFIGAEIPYHVVSKYIVFTDNDIELLFSCVVRFFLAVLFAFFITKYIEQPIIKYGKKREAML